MRPSVSLLDTRDRLLSVRLTAVRLYINSDVIHIITFISEQWVIWTFTVNAEVGFRPLLVQASRHLAISLLSLNQVIPLRLEVRIHFQEYISALFQMLIQLPHTVSHGSEVTFVFGAPPDHSAPALHLSSMMIDYWVSFATSLDPNDGLGGARKLSISTSEAAFNRGWL